MARRTPPEVIEVVMIFAMLGIALAAGAGGFFIGRGSADSAASTTSTPAGHSGAGLPAHEFGNPTRGAALFVSKGCADCHSYAGKGGTDAPPLDYMSGHLSAREVADMSGQIWNHLPTMLTFFKAEGIPVPTFKDDQMADLIAYLHSKQATNGGKQATPGG